MIEELLVSDFLSDAMKACLGGFVIGLMFGVFAQSSRFCLRSACVEFWTGRGPGRFGANVIVWLCVFGTALALTQALFLGGLLEASEVRQLSSAGTISGAIIGGLLFGTGMILTRGCASRLLVLSATGNARALLAGLIVTVVAQASLSGVLSPLRQSLSTLWIAPPEIRNLSLYLPDGTGLALGVACIGLAAVFAGRARVGWGRTVFAILVGVCVAAGWAFTASLSRVSFDPVAVGSVTFTGPSADTLMTLITAPSIIPEFGIGLVPGVFLGSFLSSVVRREFRLQSFTDETGTLRYIVGAVLMGFGGMLAGGCAVGAGITGGAVLASTAWVALFFMWVGAGLCDRLLNSRQLAPSPQGIN